MATLERFVPQGLLGSEPVPGTEMCYLALMGKAV